MPNETEDAAEAGLHGVVFLAFDESEDLHWQGYWDPQEPPDSEVVEQGPGWSSADAAVAWGRRRAHRVFIRMDDFSDYLWAGLGEAPDGMSNFIYRKGLQE